MLWNIIWKSMQTDVEMLMLARRTREQALNYIEQYCSEFEQRTVNLWDHDNNGTIDFQIKLEKVQ